ncbi:hypothetical protein J6590_078441 [Homalodisca vitripennis]|nr:hypothetical protein J6590_078441 [Homalodisca vitripennis]
MGIRTTSRQHEIHVASAERVRPLRSVAAAGNQLSIQAENNQYGDGITPPPTDKSGRGGKNNRQKMSKLSPGSTSPTKKGATPNKTSPPLKEEPTSSGTGYGKSRTLTGNEVLSRRQTKHDPPEILRGASLGEGRKQKESKTTPQGKPGVISPRTPPQPHQYPEHDQRNVGLPPQPPRYGINQLSSNWGEKTKNPVGTCPPIAKFGCPFIHGRTDRMGLTKDKIPHLEGVSNTSLIEFSPHPFPRL